MSQDEIGSLFPSEEPTFTADASLAFELLYGLWPAKGSSTISRLSCADSNVIDCIELREWPERHRSQYHESIPRDEYNRFKNPGQSGTDTLRVWTKSMTRLDEDYESELTTGNWEEHKFRYDGTKVKFEASPNEGDKCKNDVPVEGWVWLDGKIKVNCTVIWMLSVQDTLGAHTDVNLGLGPQ
jgi:hypothetical protein